MPYQSRLPQPGQKELIFYPNPTYKTVVADGVPPTPHILSSNGHKGLVKVSKGFFRIILLYSFDQFNGWNA